MEQSEFLKEVSTWNNHLPLLWMALEATKLSLLPVAEFGAGNGSTPYLRQYCLDEDREFYSYDSDKGWANTCGSAFIEDWRKANIYINYSVVLIDQSPGEIRHETAAILKDKADILVLHDSEEGGSGQYFYEKIWPLFKHRININKLGGGAGASAVSNKIDLSQFVGKEIGGFKIEA